jgi:hypothetical protein
MIKDMTLYICPDCKVLLMRPEKRYTMYNYSELAKSGEYEDERNNEPHFDAYVCPSCGKATGEGDAQLKTIVVPIACSTELITLWSALLEDAAVLGEDCWGIPLDNPALKEILLEELI